MNTFSKQLLFIVLFLSTHLAYSQKLIFCESIDSSTSTPKRASTNFAIRHDGGYLVMFVNMPKGINSTFVTYDIFRLNEDKKERFESTIKQTVQPEYTWFSKQITFRADGQYVVYVYDDKDLLLCAGRVTIKIE